jgi:transcriptional regulator with XRE-family HTH domain
MTDQHTNGLGGYLRQQRELADLSLRQFSEVVGVSNAYLSQIERGLRRPSDQVLGAIAKGLQISADTISELTVAEQADETVPSSTLEAIRTDPALQPRQRQALVESYRAFVEANESRRSRGRATRPRTTPIERNR